MTFNIGSSEYFGKYIYNNLKYIRTEKKDFDKWIDSDLIQIFDKSDPKGIIFYSEEESNDGSNKTNNNDY